MTFKRFDAKNGDTLSFRKDVLKPGKWNGHEFTAEDLKGIADAWKELQAVLKAPLKLGHDEDQPLTDGMPALGWITNVFFENDTLYVDVSDVPALIGEAIEKKLYRTVSAELLKDVKYKGSHYKWVLTGLALLGAEIPAVNTLEDLQAYLSAESITGQHQVSFSIDKGNIEEKAMDEETKKRLEALEKKIGELTEANVTLKAQNTELQAQAKARLEAESKAKFAADKKAIEDRLEGMVKENKITPAQRDATIALIKDGDESTLKLASSATDVLDKSPGVNMSNGGGARNEDPNKKQEQGDPGEVLTGRVLALRAQNPSLSWDQAVQVEFRKDPELAKKYVLANGEFGRSNAA